MTAAQSFLALVREYVAAVVEKRPLPPDWQAMLRRAAKRAMIPDHQVEEQVRSYLSQIYDRTLKRHEGMARFTLASLHPSLRAELTRRIIESADLIKLNRDAQIEKTIARFQGWMTSVPPTRSKLVDRREVASKIARPSIQARYELRRVAIDQGHKLAANISDLVATHGGAIAAIWHDRGEHDHNYNARKEHLARSGKMFLIRDSWAIKNGLIKAGAAVYTDEIEKPAQLTYCSCWYEYLISLEDIPAEWLTKKGRAAISPKERTDNVVVLRRAHNAA